MRTCSSKELEGKNKSLFLAFDIFELNNRQTDPLGTILKKQQEVYTLSQPQEAQEFLMAQENKLLVQIPFHGFHIHTIPASFSPLFKRYNIYA